MGCRTGKCGAKAKPRLGVTVGGPTPNINFATKPGKIHYFFPTPKDLAYAGAYYTLVPRVTAIGEQMATFSFNMKRVKL